MTSDELSSEPRSEREPSSESRSEFQATKPVHFQRLDAVDEVPHQHSDGHEVHEGQERPTVLVIASSKTSEVVVTSKGKIQRKPYGHLMNSSTYPKSVHRRLR
jgi:hypothetical protein